MGTKTANHQPVHQASSVDVPARAPTTPNNGRMTSRPQGLPLAGSEYEYLAELFLSDTPPVLMQAMVSSMGTMGGESTESGATPLIPEPKPIASRQPVDSAITQPLADAIANNPAASPKLEAVLVGHLPVMASLWVTQYARHRASDSNRAVGLAQLRRDRLSLEIAGLADRFLPQESQTAAIAKVTPHLGTWLIRVDDELEDVLTSDEHLDRITILTGADEAAIIASYRTLKLLANRFQTRQRKPALNVAIMGSPSDKASQAADRLRSAVASFLEVPVTIETSGMSKLGGASLQMIHRNSLTNTEASAIRMLVGALSSPVRLADETPSLDQRVTLVQTTPQISVVTQPQPSTPRGGDRPHVSSSTPTPRARHASLPALVTTPAPAMTSETSASAALMEALDAETRQPESSRRDRAVRLHDHRASANQHASSPTKPLASHLAGLTPMHAKCPIVVHGVELAYDESGTLHVLAKANDAAVIPSAASALVAVAAWAAPHIALLNLTVPASPSAGASRTGLVLQPERPIVMHLFITRGPDARPLLDSQFRLHLLAGAEPFVQCVDLN